VVGSTVIGVAAAELREVATGWSAKRQVLNRAVYNDRNERIGTVDDIIIAPDKAVSYAIIQGYHFHFISNDRRHGAHLLDVKATQLSVRVESLTDFHLALPASEAFLKADLSKNTAQELAYAEQAH
jgi:alpha-acetolactate decarboxylase